MTSHISARLAWHNDGWNGRICRVPGANTYCVGQHSFPGQTIAEKRNLEWEQSQAGIPVSSFEQDQAALPPCNWSINAFGSEPLWGHTNPPDWFRDETRPKFWSIQPYTVGVWPYEEMYREDVLNPPNSQNKYNAEKRYNAASEYFSQIAEGRSLIFYYSNYSNPFSEEEQQRYVVVGMSRIKQVGGDITWDGQSDRTRTAYGNYVWVRNVTSQYPDQGLRIPYWAYMDRPDILNQIALFPENPRVFKYATRHISDDEALGLIERFQQIVTTLIALKDETENWQLRWDWLSSLTAELWKNRGLYPGLLAILDYLRFGEAIPIAKAQLGNGNEDSKRNPVFAFLEGRTDVFTSHAINSQTSSTSPRVIACTLLTKPSLKIHIYLPSNT